MLIAVGGIWTAVAAISLLSPDMVSGSEQQHMPVAAFATWVWGAVATYGLTRYWVASCTASCRSPWPGCGWSPRQSPCSAP